VDTRPSLKTDVLVTTTTAAATATTILTTIHHYCYLWFCLTRFTVQVYMAQMSLLHPTNNVKALKKTRSVDPKQPHPFIYHRIPDGRGTADDTTFMLTDKQQLYIRLRTVNRYAAWYHCSWLVVHSCHLVPTVVLMITQARLCLKLSGSSCQLWHHCVKWVSSCDRSVGRPMCH